jgi:hypothetical protein
LLMNSPLIHSRYENKAALIIHPNEANMLQSHKDPSPTTE